MPLKIKSGFCDSKAAWRRQEQSNLFSHFLHVKTPAEEHNPVKILNYIFNNCFAEDNADEANIVDQTT